MSAWKPTAAARRAACIGVLLLVAGVLWSRADLALLGVPLLLAPFAGSLLRPVGRTQASFESSGTEAQPGEITGRLTVQAPPGVAAVAVRVYGLGHRVVDAVISPRTGRNHTRTLPLRLASVRTGPQHTFEVVTRGISAYTDALETFGGATAGDRLVLPDLVKLGRVPTSKRLRGLTGGRTSRRIGEGTELRDIHPLTPGTPLRRVDWRTTARRSPDLIELYARRTYAGSEAQAMIVVDSRDDVGPDVHAWRGSEPLPVDEATSLDLARHASASIAQAFIDAGDRVGLEDLARRRRPLAPAGGKRHLRRILHALALTAPLGRAEREARAPQVPGDAIVYLLSTMLDDEPVRLVASWQADGIPVVVIDTLPYVAPIGEKHMRLAWTVTSMEREDRIRALTARGIPVVRWASNVGEQAATRFESLVRTAGRHGGQGSIRLGSARQSGGGQGGGGGQASPVASGGPR